MYQPRITSSSFFIGRNEPGLISFGSGQSDLLPPQELFSALPRAGYLKYGLIAGEPALREGVAKLYPGTRAEDFVITNGASEALDLTLRVLCERGGKKVLLTRPHYYSYPHNVLMAGMEPVFTELVNGRIDLADFAEKVQGVDAVIVNTPCNPTGCVEPVATLKAIEALTARLGVWLIFDEVYKQILYDGEHYRPSTPNVITNNSFSKSYSLCGLRVGFLHSYDPELVRQVIEMKTDTTMNTGLLAQQMALAALGTPPEYFAEQLAIWRARRDLCYAGLCDLGLELVKPEGAFYMLPKVNDPGRAVDELYFDHQVVVYNGEWFGALGHIRLCYALDVEKIKEGLERIGLWLKQRK
jgi:aspartate aminotransferase